MQWHSGQPFPGKYSAPVSIPVEETTAVEIVPLGGTRYLTLSNQGPGKIYLCIGEDATPSNYNVIIPSGFNEWGRKIGTQKITAICSPGETANLMVALAPEIES